MARSTLALVTIVTLSLAMTVSGDTFNASHVRFVDHSETTGNFLFRSGEPKTGLLFPRFAWDDISKEFAVKAKLHNTTFPSDDYYMVDLCLLTHEADDIAMEKKYFAENSDNGQFIHWPIYGINVTYVQQACKSLGIPASECGSEQPGTFTDANRKLLSTNFETLLNGDQLPERLEEVHVLLNTPGVYGVPANKTLALLGHCECGCDRTGEFFASYYMRYMNWTFTEAMTYDVGVPDRNIGYGNQVAAQWYCNYLYYNGLYTDREYDCNNCEAFRCSESEKTKALANDEGERMTGSPRYPIRVVKK